MVFKGTKKSPVRSANLLIKPLFINGFFTAFKFYPQLDPKVLYQQDGIKDVLLLKKQRHDQKFRSDQNHPN
jgi:hypothetical protein